MAAEKGFRIDGKLNPHTKDVVYAQVAASHPQFLHPNLNQVTRRPWGAKEFAILDKQVGIRFQQW